MMKQKAIAILTGFLICLIFCFSCSSLKKEPVEKKHYDFNINIDSHNRADLGSIMIVKEFAIDSLFDYHSFVYRLDNNEYINDYYNEFASYPARLISDKIAQALYHSIYFTSPLTAGNSNAIYRLSGRVNKIYGDFQKTNSPKAIIEIHMILEKKKENAFQKIISRTYSVIEPVLSTRPEHLLKGWNSGLSKIIVQFVNDYTLQERT